VRLDKLDRVVDEWVGGAADELEGSAGSVEVAFTTLDNCSGLAIFYK